MPTKRGWAAVGAGLCLWVAARLTGSRDLHMIAAGVIVLPLLAVLIVRWSPPRVEIHRHLSAVRASPGSRVNVSLSVENLGRGTTSFLLLEDALPARLGRVARLVVAGVPPRNAQTVIYTLLCRTRGRYSIGPLSVHLTDPFGLARTSIQTGGLSELIVYPEVEDIEARGLIAQGAGAGEASARRLHRSAAEFYTMREYVTGDDLRRIHWPSVARTGQLMIRQDEATRRSSALLFLDTRSVALGAHGAPGFERAVSVAASLGRALSRSGFALRMATVDSAPATLTEETLLEALAAASPSRTKTLGASLAGLRRSGAPGDTTLALVTAPLSGPEVAVVSRVGSAFGRRIVVLVYPAPLSTLPVEASSEMEGRASAARASLQRAGWEVYLVHAEGKLADTWGRTRTKKLQVIGTRS